MIKKFSQYLNPFSLLQNWPDTRPICAVSCMQGRYFIIATKFTEVPFVEIKNLHLKTRQKDSHLPFTTGIIGIVSYDQFAAVPYPTPSLFFAVEGALVFDQLAQTVWQTGIAGDLDVSRMLQKKPSPPKLSRLTFSPHNTDSEYLSTVQKIISDIGLGKFYLLNFLRFFTIYPVNQKEILCRLDLSGAPYRAVIRYGNNSIFSFSPEQFVSLQYQHGQTILTCSPVKGTAPRHINYKGDQQIRDFLLKSEKDLAELHITIDLARNDINGIAVPGSTQVVNPATLKSFATVHHLVGTIKATLRTDITLGEFLAAMCPAASISGAPKIEVMRAINIYEDCPRGFFMGNIFCLDNTGQLDSSVLIRTLVSTDCRTFTYAAGGGVVFDSEPEKEKQEVQTKLSVLGKVKL